MYIVYIYGTELWACFLFQPIPYWLYKLHGLNISYNCEICGNFTYKGPKAFQRHFAVRQFIVLVSYCRLLVYASLLWFKIILFRC